MHRRRSRSRSPIQNNQNRRDRRTKEKRPIDPQSDKMVYLSNLPFELKWNELKDLIRQKAGESAFVEFLEDRDGKPKGCAVLDFDNRAAALRCVDAFHRMEIGGRHITAKEIRDPMGFFRHILKNEGIDFLANRNLIPGRQGYRQRREREEDNGGVSENETYGLSPTFLGQLNIKPPLVNRVFVTNIPYNCGVGKLYDIFSLAGRITWFDLQLDSEGKTKGMAIIQFSHPIEAVQAISMLNNQRLFDRTLSVKMDRFDKDIPRQDGELPAGLRAIGMGLGSGGQPLANVASVISSLTGVNGGAVSVPQPTIQPFVQPPMNGNNSFSNQSFSQAPLPAPTAALNGSFVNNSMNMAPLPAPTAALNGSFVNNSMNMGAASGDPASMGYVQPQVALPQNTQPPAAYSGNSFFNNAAAAQPVNNGPPLNPSMNTGGFNSTPSNNMYPKMSPQVNYGQQQQQPPPQQQQQNKPYYDTQPSRVILIKNLPMDYTWQIVHDRVQKFGEVENVEIISPGVAKVRYVRIPDAERTKAQLSGTTVEGRIIAIEYL
uniref:RRM domain-containing protein n=1 Tax=Panagrolaimus sp. ES5 TaxID=591445 RepID=A0AC34FSM5_9BILA